MSVNAGIDLKGKFYMRGRKGSRYYYKFHDGSLGICFPRKDVRMCAETDGFQKPKMPMKY